MTRNTSGIELRLVSLTFGIARQRFFRPPGLGFILAPTHGLRHGLYSFAASRLDEIKPPHLFPKREIQQLRAERSSAAAISAITNKPHPLSNIAISGFSHGENRTSRQENCRIDKVFLQEHF